MNKINLYFMICFFAFAAKAVAVNSTEVKLTLGENYRGYKMMTSADLDSASTWSADVLLAKYEFEIFEGFGWNNVYFLGLNYLPNDSLNVSINYSHSIDNNGITMTGPGVNIFYTYFRFDPMEVSADEAWFSIPIEVFTIGLDCPVTFYRADMETESDSVAVNNINLTQTDPTLFLDIALIHDFLNVNVSGSYFLYSNDPAEIATLVDPSVSSTAAASLESLMTSMLWLSWRMGVFVTLPFQIQVSGNYGKQKQVYPEEWVDSYELSLSVKPWNFIKPKLTWRHFSSSVGQNDFFAIALRFYY